MMGNSSEYLGFTLEGEEYGIDILAVREVRGWTDVRQLPESPDYLLGVLDLRGEYVPVVDLRRCFSMPAADIGPTTVLIIVRNADGQSLGIIVDAVSEVYEMEAGQIKPPPEVVKFDRRYIEGITEVSGKHVVLIRLEQLFDFTALTMAVSAETVSEE